ncbi:MAG: helix-turn-helix domain-containing protein [Thermoleophilia bacterium]
MDLTLNENEPPLDVEPVEPTLDRPDRHLEVVGDLLNGTVGEVVEQNLAEGPLELVLQESHRRCVTCTRQHERQNARWSSIRQDDGQTSAGSPYRDLMPGIPASKEFGLFVKRRRQDIDLEQTAIAEALGWSVATQGRIERGKRSLRHDGEVKHLADVLKVTQEELREHRLSTPPVEQPADVTLDAVLRELQDLRQIVEGMAGRQSVSVEELAADLEEDLRDLGGDDQPPPEGERRRRSRRANDPPPP